MAYRKPRSQKAWFIPMDRNSQVDNEENKSDYSSISRTTYTLDSSSNASEVKLPPFWGKDPVLWFAQVDKQFKAKHVMDSTRKYELVVANLDPEAAEIVRELIIQTPKVLPYETLRSAMIARTTLSNHPQCNGIIERFHRQLKTALKARLTNAHWVDELPIVLLGIRAAWKEDLGCSAAELTYGAPLRLPGVFFEEPQTKEPSSVFLSRLRETMSKLRPKEPSRNKQGSTHVPKEIFQTPYVFVRCDSHGHLSSLQRPYEGPYKVIKREKKYRKTPYTDTATLM